MASSEAVALVVQTPEGELYWAVPDSVADDIQNLLFRVDASAPSRRGRLET